MISAAPPKKFWIKSKTFWSKIKTSLKLNLVYTLGMRKGNLYRAILPISLCLFPLLASANFPMLDATITPQGVISSYSVVCNGTNATALLLYGDSPFSYSVDAYMRRPCLNGRVNFDNLNLPNLLTYIAGAYPAWTQYFRLPIKIVVKDTTSLYAPDAPIYYQIINLYSAQNNYDHGIQDPNDPTYPTLGVGNSFDFDGSTWSTIVATSSGNSSVLFLPGIEASRLYRKGRPDELVTERKLWEPGGLLPGGFRELQSLMMDESGKPIPPLLPEYGVYTRDVMDEAYGTFNNYKSFLAKLEEMKSVDHSIADYSAVPYDWRLSIDDILNNGTKSNGNISYLSPSLDPYIISELRRLASSSQNGKVTIVAHSMGGLVAKALMKKLQDSGDPLLSKIDKVIFVAVPQLGTPAAVAGLLHGYDEALPFKFIDYDLNSSEARDLGHNMESAYELLPSKAYFDSVGTPVVTFSSNLLDWISRYGSTTTTESELHNFLVDTFGRAESSSSDTNDPDSLRENLLTQAENFHNNLDNWSPPNNVKVIEIAGWGVPTTVSGVNYLKDKNGIKLEASMTIDGDGTVVVPSALYSNEEHIGKYWVDLYKYNKFHIDIEHRDIFEVSDLINFTRSLILNKNPDISGYICTSTPDSTGIRLIYSLHSPLTLDAYDNFGNHTGVSTTTGLVEENIPGSYYLKFGDIQYIFTDTSSPNHIFMNGYADGVFTFQIEELEGDTHISSDTFKDIPTSSSTRASFDVSGDITTASPLKIDTNNDGIIDFSLKPKIDGVVSLPNPLTVTAENKNILLGAAIQGFTYNITGFINGETATTSDVTGQSACSTIATNTSLVGIYPITCVLGSLDSQNYYFKTFVPGSLTISYRFDGFLQPINDTAHQSGQSLSVFKAGSTVPFKIQLKKSDGTALQSTNPPIWLSPQKGSVMSQSIDESIYSDPGTTGNEFKKDPVSKQYIYNWSTRGLSSGYWYKIFVKLDDGNVYSVIIGLR